MEGGSYEDDDSEYQARLNGIPATFSSSGFYPRRAVTVILRGLEVSLAAAGVGDIHREL